MTVLSGPGQECCEERFKTMRRWRRTKESGRVDEWRDRQVLLIVESDDAKVWTIGNEVRNDTVVFLRLARASRIDKTSTGAHDFRRAQQQRHLVARERNQIVWMPPPSNIRIPPHRPQAGAGCVDEDRVERRRKWQRASPRNAHD